MSNRWKRSALRLENSPISSAFRIVSQASPSSRPLNGRSPAFNLLVGEPPPGPRQRALTLALGTPSATGGRLSHRTTISSSASAAADDDSSPLNEVGRRLAAVALNARQRAADKHRRSRPRWGPYSQQPEVLPSTPPIASDDDADDAAAAADIDAAADDTAAAPVQSPIEARRRTTTTPTAAAVPSPARAQSPPAEPAAPAPAWAFPAKPARPPSQRSFQAGHGARFRRKVEGIDLRSDFDSGNLVGARWREEDGRLDVQTSPDAGVASRRSLWFYFSACDMRTNEELLETKASRLVMFAASTLTKLRYLSLCKKVKVRPVVRSDGVWSRESAARRPMAACADVANDGWSRVEGPVEYVPKDAGDDGGASWVELQWSHEFKGEGDTVRFAYCYPYSYGELQSELDALDARFAAATPSKKAPSSILYTRELLCRTADGRRCDLLTITNRTTGPKATKEREPRPAAGTAPTVLPRDDPDQARRRPLRHPDKRHVLVTARVHPGETPASFMCGGLLRVLLDADDPRGAMLRDHFVFSVVPMLNP